MATSTGQGTRQRRETFVALRTEVQNWAGRRTSTCTGSGSRRSTRRSSSTSATPAQIFQGTSRQKLVIKLQPEDGLELRLLAAQERRGQRHAGAGFLDLDFDKAFTNERVGGYERLLLDALCWR